MIGKINKGDEAAKDTSDGIKKTRRYLVSIYLK